jgi:hypothetical protein
MALGACSSDGASGGLDGADVSVLKQPEVLFDGGSASRDKAESTVPVELVVLERSTLNGAMFDPTSLAGKEVLLWFWAPW